MTHHHFVISDRLWQLIAPLLPGKATDRDLTARDNRLFLEVVFWRVGTGALWRDLPPGFGKWNSQLRRFQRWANSRVLQRLFQALSGHPDLDCCSSTAPLSRFTRGPLAQKGDSASVHWPIPHG